MSEALIVTFGIIALIASITITAIVRYSAEDVLKIWGSLSVIVALLVGGIGTYFFSRDPIARETSRVAKERDEVALAKKQTLFASAKVNAIKETQKAISDRQEGINEIIAKSLKEQKPIPNNEEIKMFLESNKTDTDTVNTNLKALADYKAILKVPSIDSMDNSKTQK